MPSSDCMILALIWVLIWNKTSRSEPSPCLAKSEQVRDAPWFSLGASQIPSHFQPCNSSKLLVWNLRCSSKWSGCSSVEWHGATANKSHERRWNRQKQQHNSYIPWFSTSFFCTTTFCSLFWLQIDKITVTSFEFLHPSWGFMRNDFRHKSSPRWENLCTLSVRTCVVSTAQCHQDRT